MNYSIIISHSFCELLCSPIVHMYHMKNIFDYLPFFLPNEVPEKHKHFWLLFYHRGKTNFVVLAQTLIKTN